MVKKIFNYVFFTLSVLLFLATVSLTVDMIKEYNYLNSLQGISGSDYLGFLLYRCFYFIEAFFGIATSVISLILSKNKVLKVFSIIFLIIFSIIFVVFGIAWFGLII